MSSHAKSASFSVWAITSSKTNVMARKGVVLYFLAKKAQWTRGVFGLFISECTRVCHLIKRTSENLIKSWIKQLYISTGPLEAIIIWGAPLKLMSEKRLKRGKIFLGRPFIPVHYRGKWVSPIFVLSMNPVVVHI